MSCSICGGSTPHQDKCRRGKPSDLQKIQAELRDLALCREKAYQASLRRGPPRDWHAGMGIYLDGDQAACEEAEHAAQMQRLLRAWRDAGGTLTEIPGGHQPGTPHTAAPLLYRLSPEMEPSFPARARIVETRVARWTPALQARLLELRDELWEVSVTRDPVTRRAHRLLVLAWRRSPQAALWRWEQHYRCSWPTTPPQAPLDAPQAAPAAEDSAPTPA